MRAVFAWARLTRISLFPTAVADIVAGAVLASGRWPGLDVLWVALGSLCVYHGGMVLNDWADQGHDLETRPDRPLTSGSIRPTVALVVGWLLIGAGPLVALPAGREPSGLLVAAGISAVVYDLWGRGPLLGPLLIAACRALNLGAGVAIAAAQPLGFAPIPAVVVAAPLLYGAYVFTVSRLGRLEDGEDEAPLARRPSRFLILAAIWLVAAGALAFFASARADSYGPWPALVLAGVGAFGLVQLAVSTPLWTGPLVGRAMGQALRRLLVFTAALALAAQGVTGLVAAAAILCGYAISHTLGRWFPPS